MIFLSIFLQGTLTFLSPCILPLLPLYFSYLGLDLSDEPNQKSHFFFILKVISFILGFTTLFVLLGTGASQIGQFLQQHLRFIQQFFGLIIFLIGLSYFIAFKPYLFPLFSKFKLSECTFFNFSAKASPPKKQGSLISAYFMGMAIASSWQACLSTPLAFALIMAGQQETLLEGVFLLLAFSLGLGFPFFLFALFFRHVQSLFVFFKKHNAIFKYVAGAMMLVLGLLMLTGYFSQFMSFFT